MADITITGEGRAKGRRIAHCLCPDCGAPFSARWDHVKCGKVKRCPACRGTAPRVEAPAPAPPITEPVIHAQPTEPVAQTPEWYRAEIDWREKTLSTLMEQAGALARLIESEGGVQPSGMDGKSAAALYRENITTAAALRKDKRALEAELYAIEGRKEKTLSPIQSVMQRAAALKGKR